MEYRAICTAIQHPVTFCISIDDIIRHKLLMQSYTQFSIHEKLLLFFVHNIIFKFLVFESKEAGGSFVAQVYGFAYQTDPDT